VVVRQGRRLLDGASLAVAPGEIAVVTGASGSGKSTLLRALATLTPIDHGQVLLEGIDATAISPRTFRTRVALVPQQPPMFDGTVATNLATGPRLRGLEPSPESLALLLERVGLPRGLLARDVRGLSGGEMQRVALARALANEPTVLLLDEPTAALDPAAAAHVLALVRTLARDGLAVVLVTHIAEHARAVADVAYECTEGRLRGPEPRP
jgi:ABC-type multidrug transport system ATPase subunit